MTTLLENSNSYNNTINRTIYILWLGDEEINEKRRKSIDNLPKNTILITKTNLDKYILPEYPLHAAYEYLSTVHKSDYFRCYLMYHYGGGYSDVKFTTIDWERAFDKMEQNNNIWMMGVKTHYGHTYTGVELWDESTKQNILDNINSLFCMGYFICRPKTPIVSEWYEELNKRLDLYLPELKNNPAKYTRECFDINFGVAFDRPTWEGPNKSIHTKYPLSWNILLSQVLYPLEVKYINNIDISTMITLV